MHAPPTQLSTPMNKFSAAAVVLTLLAAAMPLSAPLNATAVPVQRCQAPDGTTMYTDKPCGMFGAQAAPMSGELLTRIAREQAMAENGGTDDTYTDAIDMAGAVPVSRRSAASGCARSTTQLSMDLQGAMALGDVNRIAESYHWVGLSNRQGQQLMQRLETLAGQSLVKAQYYNAQIGSGLQLAGAGPSAAFGGNAGMMQMTFGQGGARTVVDLDVERYQGCYFVRF